MLTRQGWLVGGGGIVALALARLLGLGELYVFGAVALGLVACAVALVGVTRLELEVDRTVHPKRVHVGQPSAVELRVRNLRRTDTPVLHLHDPVSTGPGAELLVPPLDRGAATAARYRLPTDHRGIVSLGPLRVVVIDPFGLARATTVAAPLVQLTVLPAVDDIAPVPLTAGQDPTAGTPRPNTLGRSGDDFYALRPYVVGDDLRRIHWPSTARHDELLVRQQEQPWQGRTTVLLDVRRAGYDEASFEAAVSAAASVLVAGSTRGDLVRLVTTEGHDWGFGSGASHLAGLFEHLAVVARSGSAALRTTLDLLQRTGGGGALVAVTGATTPQDDQRIDRLGRRYGSLVVVRAGTAHGDDEHRSASRPRTTVVRVDDGHAFAEAWARTLPASGRAAPRAHAATRSPW